MSSPRFRHGAAVSVSFPRRGASVDESLSAKLQSVREQPAATRTTRGTLQTSARQPAAAARPAGFHSIPRFFPLAARVLSPVPPQFPKLVIGCRGEAGPARFWGEAAPARLAGRHILAKNDGIT